MQGYEITHHCYVLENRLEHFSGGGIQGRCWGEGAHADPQGNSVEQIFSCSFIAEPFSILPAFHFI